MAEPKGQQAMRVLEFFGKALPMACGALGALLLVWLLDHGIWFGSRSGVNEGGFYYKTCKYLFVTGITESSVNKCPSR